MKEKRELIKKYKAVKRMYYKLERQGAGHLLSPLNPLKKLYKDTLREMVSILDTWNEIDDISSDLSFFELQFFPEEKK